MRRIRNTRFSDHFELNATQSQLDFVDVPLYTDILLFVDPYALSIVHGEWFQACADTVVEYFQCVVDAIRSGDTQNSLHMLSHLREPNDTHLGYSRGSPSGRGVGHEKAMAPYRALSGSRAVQTGSLTDLADCELVIPGISRDTISDMTINIIRGALLDYTAEQCALHRIPTSQRAAGHVWNVEKRRWEGRYADLPVVNRGRILLVPKSAARRDLLVNHRDYYNHFVLEYLRAEFLVLQRDFR